jgi:purine catabolism regulator
MAGITVEEARTPAFPALHGGELALVSLPLLRQVEPQLRLERLVAQLADAGVQAIVLLEAAAVDRALLEPAGAAADEHALPVFVAPAGQTAEAIDAAVHRQLAARREVLLQRGQEVQQELTALALAGRGLPAIVERLAAITGLPAAWEDRALEVRHWALPPAPSASAARLPADLPALLRAGRLALLRWANSLAGGTHTDLAVLPLHSDRPLEASPWKRLVVPFTAGGQVAGYLSLLCRHETPDQEARLALAGAGLAASIEALRMRTVSEAQGNATANLVRDWVAGRFEHVGELASRARQLGHAPRPPYGVLLLESDQALSADGLERLAQAVAAGAPPAEAPAPLWATLDERRTVLLVPVATAAAVETAAEAVQALLASPLPGTRAQADPPAVIGGVGRAAARIEDVPRVYREALQALAIARRLGGRHRVAYFGALGVYRLLAAVTPVEELASFYDDTLGALVAHDRKSGGELLRTLEAYLGTGGSLIETAQRLHAHRNTVLYRLDRISEVLGVDVRHPEQRLILHLALRAGHLLGDLQPGSGTGPDGNAGGQGPAGPAGADELDGRAAEPGPLPSARPSERRQRAGAGTDDLWRAAG